MNARSGNQKKGKVGSTVFGVFAAGPVLAQGTLPATAPQSAPLPAVSVSGQIENDFKVDHSENTRFTAPLVDTPKSVTVIPRALIDSTGATTLVEALRTVPGITFGAGEGGNPLGDRPFLRGYDTQGSTFIDGMRDIGATTREVFNTESVEVVKGSDGAFGGRGGAGGSVNINSKAAHLGNAAEGTIGVGTDSYKRFTADGNYQFADHAAFRLNFMAHGNDVAGRNVVDNDRWGIAPSLAFGLGTPTRLTLSYYHLNTDDIPDSGIPFYYTSSNAPRGTTTLYPAKVDRDTFYGLADRDFRKTSTDMGTIKFEHDFGEHLTLRNMTRLTKSSQDFIWTQPDDSQGNVANGQVWRRANTRIGDVTSAANQTELLGDFMTGSFKHSFTVGAEFSRESSSTDAYNVATATGAICRTAGIGLPSGYNCTGLYAPNPYDPWSGAISERGDPSYARTVTKAAYAFDTIELTKQIQANIGLRVDDYSTQFTDTRANGGKRTDRDDTLFNYQFGLVYKPLKNGSIYASYATSSTPAGALLAQGSETQTLVPGRGGVGANAAQLAPEKNRSIEFGTKWNVLDNKLALNAAIFQIDTTNARVTLADNTYAMVGSKRVQGLELGFAGRVTNKWNVFGGYTYLKSELRDNGVTTANNGKVFPNTPRNSFSLWSTYDVMPAFTVGGGAFFMSEVFGDPANVHAVPSYWRFDAMATYRINKKLEVQLNVLNVLNRTYYDQVYPTHYASMAPGRSAFVTLKARY